MDVASRTSDFEKTLSIRLQSFYDKRKPGKRPRRDGYEELESYFTSDFECLKAESFDILKWWSRMGTSFPILSLIAKDVLAVTASTATIDQAFGDETGYILDYYQSTLPPWVLEHYRLLGDWVKAEDRKQEILFLMRSRTRMILMMILIRTTMVMVMVIFEQWWFVLLRRTTRALISLREYKGKKGNGLKSRLAQSDIASVFGMCELDGDQHYAQVWTTSYSGIPGDGRCLFRSVVHGACLRSGKPSPSESQEKELADELRAAVADELIKRRADSEWFVEGDFETYVAKIRHPHVWGGEPELLMSSHVLQLPITVHMWDKKKKDCLKVIAEYGQEYGKGNPIRVLYHGYGHYDALQSPSNGLQAKLSNRW